ncbi:hypothetical protein [Botrimarina hoheduenensis]|uniref:Uncharacterized protein n=1 Tax=Botrimarina hoheduenensis TaxID=2528000 RepID=A0A5C5W9C9_9BACT|nr:hypothetical protein [Botrimarina hoheduenensis]TWT46629.1 hypothetical protein Pla111_17300 [Botrimarina hoheduenensis]
MTELSIADLWLPMVAAGLATHILSTLAWVALPHHKPEWRKLPLSGAVGQALRTENLQPGAQYMLSDDSASATSTDDCRGMLILWQHTPHMGANIGMTLAFFFAAAATIGYLASIGLRAESPPIDIFRFTATAAALTHVAAGIPSIIWFRRKFAMDLLDGLAYSLATGAAFTLLWPAS